MRSYSELFSEPLYGECSTQQSATSPPAAGSSSSSSGILGSATVKASTKSYAFQPLPTVLSTLSSDCIVSDPSESERMLENVYKLLMLNRDAAKDIALDLHTTKNMNVEAYTGIRDKASSAAAALAFKEWYNAVAGESSRSEFTKLFQKKFGTLEEEHGTRDSSERDG